MPQTVTKGYMENLSTGQSMRFQYNPETLSDKGNVKWAVITAPGISYPRFQFTGGDVRTLSFQLFLDDLESPGTIQQWLDFLAQFKPKVNNSNMFSQPPMMLFAFGTFVQTCLLVTGDPTHNMFDNGLRILRSTIDVTLNVVQ